MATENNTLDPTSSDAVTSDGPPPLPPQRQQLYQYGAHEQPWPYETLAAARVSMNAAILTSASYELLARARQLSLGSDADRQLAVIFAHSACELHTEQILADLLRHRASPLSGVIFNLLGSSIHLGNGKVLKVYTALTNDNPAKRETRAAWWDRWLASCHDLRNNVAHQGLQVTPDQARLAVESAVAYLEHLSRVAALVLR